MRKHFRAYARTEKLVAPRPAASLLEYRDCFSGEVNLVATRSGLARICGGRLSYATGQPDEGLFFVPEDSGEAIRVADNCVNLIKPSALSFANPGELEPGVRYRLEVRNRPRNVIELRVGALEDFVTAAEAGGDDLTTPPYDSYHPVVRCLPPRGSLSTTPPLGVDHPVVTP